MNKLKIVALSVAILIATLRTANAESVLLQPDDFIGMTYWLLSMGCLAATAFFFLERGSVASGWRLSITVAGIITGIAFVHSLYMRDVWVSSMDSPIVYRYIDWLITMPLLMAQFYFVLSAFRRISSMIFYKLFIGTLVMVLGGYAGEANHIPPFMGFLIWMAAWIYVLYEIFSGDAGKIAAKSVNKNLIMAYGTMRMIVTIGWAVYPLCYVFGPPLTGGVDSNALNVIYNFADFINKIGFGLVIWVAAIASTSGSRR